MPACYRRSLELAAAHALATIAFPAISCGVYGYPPELAVPIAVAATRRFTQLDVFERIIFACNSNAMQAAYEDALRRS